MPSTARINIYSQTSKFQGQLGLLNTYRINPPCDALTHRNPWILFLSPSLTPYFLSSKHGQASNEELSASQVSMYSSKRSFAVGLENVGTKSLLSVKRNAEGSMAEDLAEKEKEKEKAFWMKDPKTGNWIPESHFGEIDAADLRAKHLSKKEKF